MGPVPLAFYINTPFTDFMTSPWHLRFVEAKEATHELKTFMQTQVAEKKVDIHSQGAAALDVFSMLVEASENEEAKFKLDDSELVCNDSPYVCPAAD